MPGFNSSTHKNGLRERMVHFIYPPEKEACLPVGSIEGQNPRLAQARARIANGMIRVAALVGLPVLLLTLPLFITYNQLQVGLIYAGVTVALGVLALWTGMRQPYRIMLFITLYYLLGLSEMLNYGYSIEGYIFLLVFVLCSALFCGQRMAIAAFWLSLVTMVSIGLLVVTRQFMPFHMQPEQVNYLFESWMVSWLIFTMMAILISSSTLQVLNYLDASWKKEAEAKRQLQAERDLLEQRVQERTRDLSAARDQALSANHYKSELMARLSHELRTPLGAILGYAEMLQKNASGALDDKQKLMLHHILNNSEHLGDLINDLLDQSYLERGDLHITQRLFAVQALRDHALGFRGKAESKGLRLHVQVDEKLPGALLGDEKRARQILSNLISNAVKFTDHGEVRVRLAALNPSTWMIEVQDTGPGISPEVQTHIFEPFWQLDTSITRAKDGYGLGLALVKQISELLDGQVGVQSTPGQGSTFRVTLPLRTAIK